MAIPNFIRETLKPENFWLAAAVIVALFGEKFWFWLRKPNLEVRLKEDLTDALDRLF